jgi:hypothetical protein
MLQSVGLRLDLCLDFLRLVVPGRAAGFVSACGPDFYGRGLAPLGPQGPVSGHNQLVTMCCARSSS